METRKINGQKFERSFTLERGAVNAESRTVELAFASENPVERWFGFEILDCSPKAVRLGRLQSSGPVLVGHDPDDHVGVVERVSVDKDKVCRATVRFSRSARGQEILDDIADGIRTNVSVGYVIDEVREETKRGEDIKSYRATAWTPHEISIVSMPADLRVGVARELDTNTQSQEETSTMEEITSVQQSVLDVEAQRQSIVDAEQKRIRSIIEEGNKYADKGGPAIAQRLIVDPTATVDTFKILMLEEMNQRSKIVAPVALPQGHTTNNSIITANLRYNPLSLNAFKRFGNKAEEMAYRGGMWARAILFRDPQALRVCNDQNIRIMDNKGNVRVMNEMTGSAGGFTVPDEMEGAITDLRVEYGIARRLCKVFPMGSDTMVIPIRTAGVTAQFTAEQGAPTASDMTWGQATLVAKNLMAETRITTQLAEDAVVDIAAIVADEHAWAFAAKEDQCFINGDGTSTYGGIVGLIPKFEAAYSTLAGVHIHAGSANAADAFTEVTAAELSGVMAKCPTYARNGARFLINPSGDSLVFERLMAAGGGNTTVTLAGQITPAYLGKVRTVAEVMPGSATDFSNKVMMMYGDFSKACFFGDRRGITIQPLYETYAVNGQIGILGTERFDVNVQYAIGDTTSAGSVVALVGV